MKKIKLTETELTNIIKKTINESQLLLERPCDWGSCAWEVQDCCYAGMAYQVDASTCKNDSQGNAQCSGDCGPGRKGSCGGKTIGGGKGPLIKSKDELQRMVNSVTGNNKAKDETIAVSESELINIINEELLLEKRVCGWWLRDGGSACERRRRQQAWNCGGHWEDVSPNDDWGCANFASVVPRSDGSEVWRDDRLSERHIRRLLKKL